MIHLCLTKFPKLINWCGLTMVGLAWCVFLSGARLAVLMPRPRKSCAESRSHISLDATANRHVETIKRRVGCYNDFCDWIKKELHLPLTAVHFPPLRMSEALTGYGKHLFYSGLPKYLFAETINAVIDRFPNYRGQISAAWTTD